MHVWTQFDQHGTEEHKSGTHAHGCTYIDAHTFQGETETLFCVKGHHEEIRSVESVRCYALLSDPASPLATSI